MMILGFDRRKALNEKIKSWRRWSEHSLKREFCKEIQDKRIPFISEYRIDDNQGCGLHYLAIDIAVFSITGEPLIAIELKNTESRDEAMRGLGQCIVYKHAGFPSVALVTRFAGLEIMRDAAALAGISMLYPWELMGYVEAIYNVSGGRRKNPGESVTCRFPRNADPFVYIEEYGELILSAKAAGGEIP